MKKIIAIVALALSMIGGANAASTDILNITGFATPWSDGAETIELGGIGVVNNASGVFDFLDGGSIVNYATVVDLANLRDSETPIGGLNITIFEHFNSLSGAPTGLQALDATFTLREITSVQRTPTIGGEFVRVDTQIEAITNGVNQGIFGFRWEISNNGRTGSYSVSTPIPPVPVPAAAWLFGSALLGLASVKRRRQS